MASVLTSLYGRFSPLINRPCKIVSKRGDKLTPMEIGELGERIALAVLRARGRKILYRNYRGPRGGEVDIVARDMNTLSFVEVKTRTNKGYGRPLDAVDVAKQELIQRGADSWLKLLGTRDLVWRFDVVEVVLSNGELPEINVIENAF